MIEIVNSMEYVVGIKCEPIIKGDREKLTQRLFLRMISKKFHDALVVDKNMHLWKKTLADTLSYRVARTKLI